MKRSIGFLILIILLPFYLTNCYRTKAVYSLKTINADFKLLKNTQHDLNRMKRLSFQKENSRFYIYGVTNSNYLVKLAVDGNTIDTIFYFLIPPDDIIGLSIQDNFCYYVDRKTNQLHEINTITKVQRKISENAIPKHKFIKSAMYNHKTIFKLPDEKYIAQIGDRTDSLNYSGNELFIQWNTKNSYANQFSYYLEYPYIYKKEYIHYNDVSFSLSDSVIYYTFPTINKIYSYNIVTDEYSESKIPVGRFISFDTGRITDPLYIHDYTNKTSYNVLTATCNNYIVVLQRNQTDKYFILIYDKNLVFNSKIKLDFNPIYELIFSDSTGVYFGISYLNQINKLTVNPF